MKKLTLILLLSLLGFSAGAQKSIALLDELLGVL